MSKISVKWICPKCKKETVCEVKRPESKHTWIDGEKCFERTRDCNGCGAVFQTVEISADWARKTEEELMELRDLADSFKKHAKHLAELVPDATALQQEIEYLAGEMEIESPVDDDDDVDADAA